MNDPELLTWTQTGPDAVVRVLIGDPGRGQIEVVLKLVLQNLLLVGHDPSTGYPQIQVQSGTIVRIAKMDPGWRAIPKPPEGRAYG